MIAISFLGTGNYSETVYHYQGLECQTRFFPVALSHFLQLHQILICVTPTVLAHQNLTNLKADLDHIKVKYQIIQIAEGHSEQDLWEIFETITGAVDGDEPVVFDVTHSLRSLPMLVFLAVAYLKAARQVEVARILYGAYDARDIEANRSPVFDLTPFVTLLDWTTATARFIETGDGEALAKLLRQGMPGWPQIKNDYKARALAGNLRLASKSIEEISLALQLARPFEVLQSSAQFKNTLKESIPGIQAHAKPFVLLVDRMGEEYEQFAQDKPTEPGNWKESLCKQLEMIGWYISHRYIVQAATLAREWVVSLLALELNAPLLDPRHGREPIEWALNNLVESSRPSPRPPRHKSKFDLALINYPYHREFMGLWSQITELRNDIAHTGMRSSPKTAKELRQSMKKLYAGLRKVGEEVLKYNNSSMNNSV